VNTQQRRIDPRFCCGIAHRVSLAKTALSAAAGLADRVWSLHESWDYSPTLLLDGNARFDPGKNPATMRAYFRDGTLAKQHNFAPYISVSRARCCMGSGLGLAVSKISHPVRPSSKLGTHADSDAIENGAIHRLYEYGPRGASDSYWNWSSD
jgi:hypothetical protein